MGAGGVSYFLGPEYLEPVGVISGLTGLAGTSAGIVTYTNLR